MVDLPAPEGPTMASVLPGGTSKLMPFQNLAVGIIGKMHIVEAQMAPGNGQRLRAWPVGDLRVLAENIEHHFEIEVVAWRMSR